jgi:hypothetical protein
MNRRLLNTVLFVLFVFAGNVFAQVPKAACGKIVHIEKFASNLVEPRNIDIWLPRVMILERNIRFYICTTGKIFMTLR